MHNMEILEDLKDMLCQELDKIVEKKDINPTELEVAYKAVDIIKDITTIEAMEEADFGDYSYDDAMTYRRHRDDMGRYSGRRMRRSYDDGKMMPMDRGYSGADSKEHLMHEIEEMQHKLQQM